MLHPDKNTWRPLPAPGFGLVWLQLLCLCLVLENAAYSAAECLERRRRHPAGFGWLRLLLLAPQLGWSERGGRRLRLPVKVPPPAPPATDHSLPPGTGTVKIHNWTSLGFLMGKSLKADQQWKFLGDAFASDSLVLPCAKINWRRNKTEICPMMR